MSRRACTRRSTMSSMRCCVAQREERLAPPADEGEGEAGVLVVVLDDGVALRAAGRHQLALLVQLVTHPLDHPLAAAELVGRGVESLDGRVEGVLVGELELLGDRGVDRQPREPHDGGQQQRLEEGQQDHAAGDQHDQVAVGERGAGVQRVRDGEGRGEGDGAAEPGHRAHGALASRDAAQPLGRTAVEEPDEVRRGVEPYPPHPDHDGGDDEDVDARTHAGRCCPARGRRTAPRPRPGRTARC